ncbi:MAG: TadE family protein [Lachnospiraceae bacterium]|nr:pilus assembly protein [Clostridiales bacterium]MDD6293150.1 pilus assembly protein [Eubacteriales bacterium]MDY2608337.1 TadE family protein [Lachnospiraceae bacterium]
MRTGEKMNIFKRYLSGSLTVEMSMLFPIIIMVILTIMMLVFYMNDIICVRAAAQQYGIICNTDEKSENEIYSEYMNRIKADVIIAKIKSVDIKKDDEKTNIKTSMSFELPIFNIRKSDNINITMYDKDNRMFIVRTKVAIDTVNIAG